MTNKEFSSAYFEQAKSIYKEILAHYQSQEWHLVVRRCQEVVELILKGFLRLAGLEVPRLHDVSHILKQEKDRLPQNLAQQLSKITSISRRLRLEREVSFYGDETLELSASSLYTEIDATQAKEDVEWVMRLLPKI